MTKKDYELIAGAIEIELLYCELNCDDNGSRATANIAKRLASKLQADNPRFNRETFLNACGVN